MKRICAFLLAIACCLSLFGCKQQEEPLPTQAATETATEATVSDATQAPTEEEDGEEVTTKATEDAKEPINKRPTTTKSSKATKATKATEAITKTTQATKATKVPASTPTKTPEATQAVATQSTQAAGHEHTFGEWALQEASTCVTEGKEVRRCSVCGFGETRALPLEDHKLNDSNLCKTCRKVIFDDNAPLVELGVVSDTLYGSGAKANTPWDVKCWNGKVYRASGDYDKNSGASIFAYDVANRVWDAAYKVKDEAIHGFVEIGGKLVAPGIDATQGWEYGNYYELQADGKWKQIRNLPNGVHCFDMIECGGKIFAGLGTEKVGNTVAVSEDGGKTFTFVPLYKDGKLCDLSKYDHSRTYEFAKLQDTAYALVAFYTKSGSATWEIYRYEDGKMHYTAEGKTLLDGSEFSRKYFGGDFEFNGTCYLTARRLYAIKDFSDPSSWQHISMPNSGKVSDAILHDGAIYVLSSRQDIKTKIYHVIIYKSTTGEAGSFEEVASYDYSGFPLSFDYDGEHFYVGCSLNSIDQSKMGMLLRIKPQK